MKCDLCETGDAEVVETYREGYKTLVRVWMKRGGGWEQMDLCPHCLMLTCEDIAGEIRDRRANQEERDFR